MEEDVMRVTGRVGVAFSCRKIAPPILLPEKHPLTGLFIESAHIRLHHLGYKATHAELKTRFWIVKGRQGIKRIIGKCVRCQERHSRAFSEETADVPLDQVRRADPFAVTGVDYAGPLYVKIDPVSEANEESGLQSNLEKKAYILLFTCAVTRAVKLELVEDMSACTFLLAFRRFYVAIHGSVSTMYSDNARTFHQISKYLLVAKRDPEVHDYLTERRISWHFNASRAPWWGGFWERMVKTTKDLLIKTLHQSRLNWVQLSTVLKEVEMSINSRPLTYTDEEELVPLTPALLLSGRSSTQAESVDPETVIASSTLVELKRREQDRLALLEHWWKRFHLEYLHDLKHFAACSRPGRRIKVGDVVLLHEDNVKRQAWKHGIVQRLFQGAGGLCRAAEVRTTGGLVTRPVQRLYPMEVRASPDDVVPDPAETSSEVAVPDAETATGENVGIRATRRGRPLRRPRRYDE